MAIRDAEKAVSYCAKKTARYIMRVYSAFYTVSQRSIFEESNSALVLSLV